MTNTAKESSAVSAILPVIAAGILTLGFSIETTVADNSNTARDSYHERVLRDDMNAMANSVRTLLALNSRDDISSGERKNLVLLQLDNLEGTAIIIDEGAEIFNYSVMSPYMGSFLHDVSVARDFALMDPPDFGPATELIDSCMHCHQNMD